MFSLSCALGGLSIAKKASCCWNERCCHLSRCNKLWRRSEPRDRHETALLTAVSPSLQEPIAHFHNGFSTEKFNWFKNWWAVQTIENLKTDRPNKVTLLGKDFIVWKGHSGNWIAMDDKCPHRLAPLSEGRIEDDGNLLCSYHAWRFNESGKCIKIPHADDEKAHLVACTSPRSAVQTYPCKTRGSILWLWPDNSASAFSDSAQASIPIEDDLADFLERSHEDGTYSPFFRLHPFGFEVGMENTCDPVHLSSTHHGVFPTLNRYQSRPLRPRIVEQTSDKQNVLSLYIDNPPFIGKSRLDIELPGTTVYYTNIREGKSHSRAYTTQSPVRAGESLIIFAIGVQSKLEDKKKANIIRKAKSLLAKLAFHFLALKLSDGDIAILHSQDRYARAKGPDASKHYYIPTNADIPAMAFRKWFEAAGESGAAYGGDSITDRNVQKSREELLDRYESYTTQCVFARSALKATEAAISVLEFVRLAAVLAGSVALLRIVSMRSVSVLSILKSVSFVSSALVLSSTLLGLNLLQKLRSQFFYVGYDFTEMN